MKKSFFNLFFLTTAIFAPFLHSEPTGTIRATPIKENQGGLNVQSPINYAWSGNDQELCLCVKLPVGLNVTYSAFEPDLSDDLNPCIKCNLLCEPIYPDGFSLNEMVILIEVQNIENQTEIQSTITCITTPSGNYEMEPVEIKRFVTGNRFKNSPINVLEDVEFISNEDGECFITFKCGSYDSF